MRSSMIALAAGVAAAAGFTDEMPAVHDALIQRINSAKLPWTAGVNERFLNMTLGQVKRLMGAKRGGRAHTVAKSQLTQWDLTPMPAAAIPASFDVTTNWPSCANVTGHIRDQSACGSCWAVSSSETINDRFCITYNYTRLLSDADTTACCNLMNGCFGSSGCDGGFIEDAWNYFVNKGVVTGDDYDGVGKGTSCYPYPFAYCSHHVTSKYPDCPANEYNTPSCPTSCPETAYGTSWSSDKHFAKTAYNINGISAMQTELMTRGSITATFTVYQDFLTYKSGVYTYDGSSPALGGHAIKIVGWGTENGVDYWRVANSWNQYWGDNGFFKIRRGTDECGIEDDVAAGVV